MIQRHRLNVLILLIALAACTRTPAGRTVVAASAEPVPAAGSAGADPGAPSSGETRPGAAANTPDGAEGTVPPGTSAETRRTNAAEPGASAEASKSTEPGGATERSEAEKDEIEKEEERKRRRRILLRTAYDDREIGEEQIPLIEAEMGIYQNEALERYVQRVAIRLLRYAPPQPFDYSFKIVDQESPNAFALPGGKIYVSRGLLALANSEDELAAVLGHEITHAAERHAAARIEHARRINPLSLGFQRAATLAAYGRDQERDADRGGQILAARAGYDPSGIATFLRKLDAAERYEVGWSRLPNFLATHPTSPQRSALAAQRASELEWTRTPGVAEDEGVSFHEHLDGLVIGADPAGGLFEDGRFVHPDMAFSLRFPPNWATANSPRAVSAVAPARDAEASLTAAGGAGETDKAIETFLEEDENGNDVRVADRRPIIVGDLSGVRIEGRSGGLHAVAAFLEHEGVVFRLMVLSASGAENKYRGRANAFLQSFRPLDENGRYSLEATRIRIAYALAGETLAQLSKRTGNDLELVYTGVLNDVFASTPLRKGQPIKIGLEEPYFPKANESESSEGTSEP